MSDRSCCVNCRHFLFFGAIGGGETTPTDPGSMECSKDVWVLSMWTDSESSFRMKMRSSLTCEMFEEVKP